MSPEWQDGYNNGYAQGIGIVIGFLDHISEISPPAEADWTKQLVEALRRAAAEIRP